jgi:hypothetical protein
MIKVGHKGGPFTCLKGHCSARKDPLQALILNNTNLVQTLTFCFFKISFNVILSSMRKSFRQIEFLTFLTFVTGVFFFLENCNYALDPIKRGIF